MAVICGIYSITNTTNGKKYIGQSIDIKERFTVHRGRLKRNIHCNKHLQTAFNKYGEDDIIFEIIEVCDESVVDEREKYWISYLKTHDRKYGYNYEYGGRRSPIRRPRTEEEKRRISQGQIGRRLTDEWRENIRLARIGTKHKSESIEKMRKTKLGKVPHNAILALRDKPNWRKGKKSTIEERIKFINSYNHRDESNRINLTEDAINDVVGGMSRRKFTKKYGSMALWNLIKEIKNVA